MILCLCLKLIPGHGVVVQSIISKEFYYMYQYGKNDFLNKWNTQQTDQMCVVFLSGCEPVDISAVC
jgi:hypothetical protein